MMMMILVNSINNNLNNDIVRMKQNKIKNSINRNTYKQENIHSNIIIKNNNNDDNNDYPKRLIYTIDGPYVIESYARRSLGPWLRYEDFYIDNNMNNIINKLSDGGCEEEIYRSDLDSFIALKIYGVGMGGEVQIINKIKEILPKLRKVRNKDFEFGYRLALANEGINIVKRSMTKLPEYKKKPLIPASRINIHSIINSVSINNNDDNDSVNSMKEIVSNYVNKITNSIYNVNDLCIFTDGSALLQGNNCADANAAIVILPIISNSNNDNDEGDEKLSTSGIGYKNDNSITTTAITDYALRIRVSNTGGLVTTPFDAELSAGLFAVTIANLMMTLFNNNDKKITIMTDSRSLCKAIRTSPTNDDSNTNESRYILWTLLLKLFNKTNGLDVKWIPGHPERRNDDRNCWSGYDIGIWEADNVAKIKNPFLHDNSDSNNSNIDKDITGEDMIKICAYMTLL